MYHPDGPDAELGVHPAGSARKPRPEPIIESDRRKVTLQIQAFQKDMDRRANEEAMNFFGGADLTLRDN